MEGLRESIDRLDARKAYRALQDLTEELARLKEEAKPGLFNFDPEGRTDLQLQINELNRTINALRARLRELDLESRAGANSDAARAESVAALAKRLMERKAAEEAVGKAVAGALQAELAMVSASAARAKALGDEAGALSAQAAAASLGLAAKQADLALTEQAIARAQEEIAARAASGVAKRSELEALAQTITALEGEAQARRGAIDAAQAEILQAELAAKTYGDQSDQLAGLIQARDRLTAAIRREGEASAALIPLQKALAVIQVQIADAANDADAGIERQTQANQRALTIDQARLAVQSDETARLAALAIARGDAARASEYARDIIRDEAKALELASEAKARDAALLQERARLLEIAGKATGGYTAEERAMVEAMRNSATMAEIESERMAIGAKAKRDAVRAGAELAERNRRLAESFRDAGLTGVQGMDDVRAAVARAASGPELEALRDGLEAAIQAGVDSAGDLAAALQVVLDKMDRVDDKKDRVESSETRRFTTSYEEMFRRYGTDLTKVQQANTGLSGEQANNLIESYTDWLREQGFFGGPRPKARSDMTAREVAAAQAAARQAPAEAPVATQQLGATLERMERLMADAARLGSSRIVVAIDGHEVARATEPYLNQISARRA
jgi:hypothetical protein